MQLAKKHIDYVEFSDFTNDVLHDPEDCVSTLIGPEGGIITVTDPASPIYGTSLKVPAGALETPVVITIRQGKHSCAFGLTPSLKLLPCGLHFKRPAILTVQLKENIPNTDNYNEKVPVFYHYDELNGQWTHNSATRIEMLGDTVLCELCHL
jgi:hypothetical protein